MSSMFDDIDFDGESKNILRSVLTHFKSIELILDEALPPDKARDIAISRLLESYGWIKNSVMSDQRHREGTDTDF